MGGNEFPVVGGVHTKAGRVLEGIQDRGFVWPLRNGFMTLKDPLNSEVQ